MAELKEKQYPILMMPALAQKTFDGLKTQTRRVIKLRNDSVVDLFHQDYSSQGIWNFDTEKFHNKSVKCPYGKIGDLLWLRETWNYIFGDEGDYYIYKAIPEHLDWFNKCKKNGTKLTWKPSLFMPREASRMTLEITDIRVERLQDISEADAIAEGILKFDWEYSATGECCETAKEAYSNIWNKINESRGFGWVKNPYVWAITYKKI